MKSNTSQSPKPPTLTNTGQNIGGMLIISAIVTAASRFAAGKKMNKRSCTRMLGIQ